MADGIPRESPGTNAGGPKDANNEDQSYLGMPSTRYESKGNGARTRSLDRDGEPKLEQGSGVIDSIARN